MNPVLLNRLKETYENYGLTAAIKMLILTGRFSNKEAETIVEKLAKEIG
jgi:hypothetical protein